MTETTLSTVQFLKRDDVQKKFQELLGKRASSFLTTVANIVSSNDMLKNAEPQSVYLAALVSATLDLPINQNLGFAYIVPYKKDGVSYAQFQMGYKGFIQLAQRSGQFKTISATPVYEGQLIEENPLTGYIFDWKAKKSDTVVGYAGYFSLINGFEKTIYMTVAELEKHGKEYSQNYKKYGTGLWKDKFDGMCLKTIIKLMLSKYAPLSVDMQKAVTADQSVIKDEDVIEVDYVDNTQSVIETTKTTDNDFLQKRESDVSACTTVEELDKLFKENKPTDPAILALFTNRKNELSKPVQS